MALLRQVAQKRGLIVFTDSDGAGFVIRNHIKSAIDNRYLKHAYIPDLYGKERRKKTPGKEGKLGVEGMTRTVLLEALCRAGATVLGEESQSHHSITKQDMVELGLSGCPDATIRRQILMKKLQLPEHMSTNALLQTLDLLLTLEELKELIRTLEIEYG